jgi:hypothetical protein
MVLQQAVRLRAQKVLRRQQPNQRLSRQRNLQYLEKSEGEDLVA